MAKTHTFTLSHNSQPVKIELAHNTLFYDGGNHREIETEPGSAKYVKVLESMEQIRAALPKKAAAASSPE